MSEPIRVHCTDCPYEGTTTDPDESSICPSCGQETLVKDELEEEE